MKMNNKAGFTLIEILVSMAIIGILSSVILANINTAREKARVAAAQLELKGLETAILLLSLDSDEWPGHQPVGVVDSGAAGNEIWDLSNDESGLTSTDGLFSGWDGPYYPSGSTTDPWGNDYFFDTDYNIGTSSTIWAAVVGSFGPNGVGQNVYDADNVIRVLVASSS